MIQIEHKNIIKFKSKFKKISRKIYLEEIWKKIITDLHKKLIEKVTVFNIANNNIQS